MRTLDLVTGQMLILGIIWLSMLEPANAREPAGYPPVESTTAPTMLDQPESTATEFSLDGYTDTYDKFGYRNVYHPNRDSYQLDWGCGGSPFRNGPGSCDTWKVGPVWDCYVDGMTLSHDDTDLVALEAAANMDLNGMPIGPPAQFTEQFDHGPGARMSLIGDMPYWQGYGVQFAYEGIEEWNAAVVFPKIPSPIPPPLDPFPPPTEPEPGEISEQRSLYYSTSWHSAEINIIPNYARRGGLMPYYGIRFMRFDDELTNNFNQEQVPPLPGSPPNEPSFVTDTVNLFGVENNLIGGQIGLRHDLWQLGRRFALQGFASAGVYCNRAKQTNIMTTTTTQFIADEIVIDPMTGLADVNPGRLDVSSASAGTAIERTTMAYVAEASLTGVCRLNRCCALRGGYQMVAVRGLYFADNAFLFNGMDTESLLLQGWHIGFEYRR